MRMNNVEIALEIMAKGMGGIFVAIFVIMVAVIVLGKLTSGKKEQ
nr:OadG-related small transporter subunit [Enterocloster alcoholdehydrogenati]